MNDKSNCIVFMTMSPRGTLQLDGAQMAVAVRTAVHENLGVDVFIASLDSDKNSYAWSLICKDYKADRILNASDMGALILLIDELFSRYANVVLEFTGGYQTLKSLIPLKRRHGTRLRLVASVYYYRNGTCFQGICSFLFSILYLKYVDQVIFGCPYAMRGFTWASFLLRKGKACVMPLAGTSSNEYDSDVAWKILKEKKLDALLLDKTIFKIVYMAQLRPMKNHVWLTKVLLPVMKEKQGIHVIFCGGEAGISFSQIKALAGEEHLEGRFHMPGRMPYETVPEILRNVDCAIIPSCTETYGFTYIEPMLFGVPVIGTRIGVGEYAIQDYFNGISFSLSSPKDLQDKIRFFAENRELVTKMGTNAKKFANEIFSMKCVAEMRVNLYIRLLAR